MSLGARDSSAASVEQRLDEVEHHLAQLTDHVLDINDAVTRGQAALMSAILQLAPR